MIDSDAAAALARRKHEGMTPEERSEHARKMARASWTKRARRLRKKNGRKGKGEAKS